MYLTSPSITFTGEFAVDTFLNTQIKKNSQR